MLSGKQMQSVVGLAHASFPLPLLHDENFCMALTLEMRVFLDAHEIGPDMTSMPRDGMT